MLYPHDYLVVTTEGAGNLTRFPSTPEPSIIH